MNCLNCLKEMELSLLSIMGKVYVCECGMKYHEVQEIWTDKTGRRLYPQIRWNRDEMFKMSY